MSDEEFNRVIEDFDWDAPVAEDQRERDLSSSESRALAEALQEPFAQQIFHVSDSLSRPRSTEKAVPPGTISRASTPTSCQKSTPTSEPNVVPAHVYFDPKESFSG